jgi:magnesium chelatase family protein
VRCNAAMPSRLVRECCRLNAEGAALLDQAMADMHFSARAYDRILKVARTLADLSGSADLEAQHVLEAVQYRSLDRQLWV